MPEGMDGNGPLVDQEAGAQQWNLFRDVADKEKTPFKSSQAFFYLFSKLTAYNGRLTFSLFSVSLTLKQPRLSYFAVGLDGTDKELHLPAQNIWHHKGKVVRDFKEYFRFHSEC
jgi:hypothetical protein